jgi:neurotransmitter:Na+ symporter, NSS family
MEHNNKRETFSSGLAVFFATLGSAVGLGNIWKFPYLTGQNGGGAFVFTYLICVILVGVPVMVAEFYIGRKARKNTVGAFKVLKASPFWRIIGYMGVASAFLIMFFYSAVAGWVYSYIFKTIRGDFRALSSETIETAAKIAEGEFTNTAGGAFSPMIWQFIVVLVVSAILIAGVKNGIEKVTKTLMPVLFILIIICVIRSLTLSSAGEGLNFLFNVDFSKITGRVILTALGLAFFKLSLGIGTMLTYASYFTEDNDLMNTSVKVAVSDTIVSLLAGIAVFPVVFQYGLEPQSGPGLLFNTIPLVFSKIPFGNILLILFFILAAIAATTAMISMAEVPVVFLNEEVGINRTMAVILTGLIIFVVGFLTVHPSSLLASFNLFGKNFFDLFDYLSSNILMILGGFLIALFVGYIVNKEELYKELSNNGSIRNEKIVGTFKFIITYVTPILLIIVFLTSTGIIKIS